MIIMSFLKIALCKAFIYLFPVYCRNQRAEATLISPLAQPPKGAVPRGGNERKHERSEFNFRLTRNFADTIFAISGGTGV